jgi:hypothetical protein
VLWFDNQMIFDHARFLDGFHTGAQAAEAKGRAASLETSNVQCSHSSIATGGAAGA